MSATDKDYFTCQELVELVTNYIEDALTPIERARFEAHLAICRGCTTYVQQMRQTIALLGKLPETTIAPQARDQLLMIFRDWKRAKQG
ncbi:MAG: zf-HC2 domain-containing protein [Roseiflexaceae bacterium]|nr:zf-HC2 domain-containing protein [Roseiflexaceae bacterium]